MSQVELIIENAQRTELIRQLDFEKWKTLMLANADTINKILSSKIVATAESSTISALMLQIPHYEMEQRRSNIHHYVSFDGRHDKIFTPDEESFLSKFGLNYSTCHKASENSSLYKACQKAEEK